MENSKIEWTDHTANFWWGCLKVSPGCQHCYAETLSHRFGKNIWGPVKTTDRELKENIWKQLPKWNAKAKAEGIRRRVFIQSMSDFFEDHPQVVETRIRAMRLIEELTNLDFLLLTKRPENVGYMAGAWMETGWPENVWLGTSVENQTMADLRIPELLKIPAKVRFLSMEPLLGPVEIHRYALGGLTTTRKLDWVIVGGESGPHARPMHPRWVRAILHQCMEAGVPFLFKQHGEWIGMTDIDPLVHGLSHPHQMLWARDAGDPDDLPISVFRVGKHAAGRLLDGREWNEFPVSEPTL